MDRSKLIGLLTEANSRIRDIQEASRNHEQLGEELAMRIEDAAALADDLTDALGTVEAQS